MKTQAKPQPAPLPASKSAGEPVLPRVFAGFFGLVLGLTIMKFGNPIILEKMIEWPTNIYEWIFNSWPVVIAHWLLVGVTVLGLFVATWKTEAPRIVVVLPVVWLVWQFIAATQSVSPQLSDATLIHFATCVICFYLGLFALGRVKLLGLFWAGLMLGLFVALASGFEQHFGGLAEARKMFYADNPDLTNVPKSMILKIESNRIFGTLFYPNALAGVILMLLPMTLVVLWSLKERFTAGARLFLVTVAGGAALACLFWSGSKGGWLLFLIIGLVAVLFMPFKRQLKVLLIACVLVLGLAGFFAKYMGFFKKGAPSVMARGDYWRAAVQTTRERPVFGTGPGTFAIPYARLKKPESEMARLTHNDYLQQASDSGVPGFLAYAAMIVGSLWVSFRRVGLRESWLKLAVWLGVLAWAMQSFVEFGLYVPALAWPAFALMGWLLAQTSKPIDTAPANP